TAREVALHIASSMQLLTSRIEVAARASLFGQLAVIVSDRRGLLGRSDAYDARVRRDRLLPLALVLVDAQQVTQRRGVTLSAIGELREEPLRAIEQPRAEVVLGERKHRVQAVRVAERRAGHDVLVHAD